MSVGLDGRNARVKKTSVSQAGRWPKPGRPGRDGDSAAGGEDSGESGRERYPPPPREAIVAPQYRRPHDGRSGLQRRGLRIQGNGQSDHGGDPAARRRAHQPHRRRRGDRAPGERYQGTGGERHRRRRGPGGDRHRRRRQDADARDRRRPRHGGRRSEAGCRAALHLQARRRRPDADRHPGLPRRGAAFHRLGGAARHRHPHPRGAPRAGTHRPRRREGRPEAGLPQPRHAGGGERSVLLHARAAEIPQDRPGGGGRHHRGGAPAGAGLAADRLHADRLRPHRHRMAGAQRRRCAGAAGCRCAGGGVHRECADRRRRARGRAAGRLRRPAELHPRGGDAAISVRQRPPGARQAADERHPRRLCRCDDARPPPRRGAVHHARSA